MIFAHPELNVPITATSEVFAMWSRAFLAQVASSQLPLAAVESSYALKSMLKLPALLPTCFR